MSQYEDRIVRVLRYIHDHPAGDLSLDGLADVAAMSRFHWHRVFRAMTGETCAEAVRRVRMFRAACWLVQTDWPVPTVAQRCGYPNLASFTRAFAEAYGQPPAAFRAAGALRPPLSKPDPEERTMFPVEILTQPARRLAAVPHRGAYPKIGRAFDTLASLLSSRDMVARTGAMIGVYYSDPDTIPEADLRSHAGIEVEPGVTLHAPLEEVSLPAGRYAVMHHAGPYSGLFAAYRYMYGDWLPKSGEELGDHPPIEVYLNNPACTAPDDLRTEVCLPLA